MRQRWTVAIAGVLLGLSSLTYGAPVLAQTAEDKAAAERLFNDAVTLMDRKDYDGACPKFAESLRLDSGIGVMLHLADCYERLGRAASAWATFREADELATNQGDVARAEVARRHAAALEPSLSTITITVAAAPPGLVITRDGVDVGHAQWGLAIPVDPGPHVVSAIAPDRRRWETTTHVPGAHASVPPTVPALQPETPGSSTSSSSSSSPSSLPGAATMSAPHATDAAPPPSSSLSTRKVAALAALGVGVVAVGVGAYFGVSAESSLGASNAGGNCAGDHCNDAGTQDRNDALHAATASTVAFIVGGAAIAGGVVLWLTAPRPQSSRVGLRGSVTGQGASVFLGGTF